MITNKHLSISDAAARASALDITRSFIVQAPAGSGKTELLTQRILKLLSTSEHPENILAITFTKKAASEMRSRIISALHKAAELKEKLSPQMLEQHFNSISEHEKQSLELSLAVLEHEQKQNWNLLDNINRIQLRTIDSFCSSVVFQLPILSGLGAQSTIEENSEELFESAATAFLDSLEDDNPWSPALMRVLEHFGKRNEQLKSYFISLLHRRLQWADLILEFSNNAKAYNNSSIKQHMEAATRDILEDFFEQLKSCSAHSFLSEIERLAHFAAGNVNVDSPLSCLKSFSHKDQLNDNTLNNWLAIKELLLTKTDSLRAKVDTRSGFPADKKSPYSENKKSMQDLLSSLKDHDDFIELIKKIPFLPPLTIDEEEINISNDICECLKVLLAYLNLEFQKRQCLDFSEIQLRTNSALNFENGHMALLKLDQQINHILIDEYQDTSQSQLILLQSLVSEWQHQENAKTLFLVGDPMQSIYRFRNADVGIFIQAQKNGIENIHLENLTLNCNFRSIKEIVEWNNAHFSESFPKRSDSRNGSVSYSPSTAFENSSEHFTNRGEKKIRCNIEIVSSEESNPISLQVEDISQSIQQLRNHKETQDESIAILVRSKFYALELIQSLIEHKVPYQAIEIDPLSQTPHIISLCNLCSVLLTPEDKLAWFALLRSSLIGLDNSALLEIEKHCNEIDSHVACYFYENMPFPEKVVNAFSRLNDIKLQFFHARLQLNNDSLSEALYKLWLALGGPCLLDENQSKDVSVFFSLLRQLESNNSNLSSTQIYSACEKLFAQQSSNANNPVNILSVHKAKGLEFDHVFIPSLDKRIRNDDKSLINWNIHKSRQGKTFLLLAPLKPNHIENKKPSLYSYLEFLAKQQERNENIRLLYVACTRPKKSLHLYGKINSKNDKNGDIQLSDPAPGSLLSLIWPSLKENEINFLSSTKKSSGVQTQESSDKNYQLSRIHPEWKNIDILNPNSVRMNEKSREEPQYANQIFTKSNFSSVLGTITHLALEQLTLIDKSSDSNLLKKHIVENQQHVWKTRIIQEGITDENDIQMLIGRCRDILIQVLSDENNFWIFDNQLEDSQCEQSLYCKTIESNDSENYKRIVIDRSFIKEGKRWIIDYKTSSPSEEQTLEAFLEKEVAKYLEQLKHYALAYKGRENLPQQLALYFPTIQKLHLLKETF